LFAVLPVSAEIIDINGTKIDILYGARKSNGDYYLKLAKDQVINGIPVKAFKHTEKRWGKNGVLNYPGWSQSKIDDLVEIAESEVLMIHFGMVGKATPDFDLRVDKDGDIIYAYIAKGTRFNFGNYKIKTLKDNFQLFNTEGRFGIRNRESIFGETDKISLSHNLVNYSFLFNEIEMVLPWDPSRNNITPKTITLVNDTPGANSFIRNKLHNSKIRSEIITEFGVGDDRKNPKIGRTKIEKIGIILEREKGFDSFSIALYTLKNGQKVGGVSVLAKKGRYEEFYQTINGMLRSKADLEKCAIFLSDIVVTDNLEVYTIFFDYEE